MRRLLLCIVIVLGFVGLFGFLAIRPFSSTAHALPEARPTPVQGYALPGCPYPSVYHRGAEYPCSVPQVVPYCTGDMHFGVADEDKKASGRDESTSSEGHGPQPPSLLLNEFGTIDVRMTQSQLEEIQRKTPTPLERLFDQAMSKYHRLRYGQSAACCMSTRSSLLRGW